jgi:chromosome segregation ATPase
MSTTSVQRINTTTQLKSLETRLKERQGRREELIKLVDQYQKELSQTNKDIHHLNQEIYNLKNQNKDIIVSEHAVLRYIERVVGIDLEDVKGKILDDTTKRVILTMGDCRFKKDGMTLVVKDNTVVTIETKEAQ